jgi:SAM-dependent methyltransferase
MGLAVTSQHVARQLGAGAEPTALWSTANPLERPGVKEAVEFAIRSANLLLGWLPRRGVFLARKAVLEVGPGQDFGFPLILIGLGANVILVDRYLAQWDENFHPIYYRALRKVVTKKLRGIRKRPIREVLKHRAHQARGLRAIQQGLESVDQIADGSIDISYSNAAFEHLAQVDKAIEQLGRITKPGGLGFHQIDLRDHRDFNRPLEYLCLSEGEFSAVLEASSWSCGNRLRYTEFFEMFEQAGFDVRFKPNLLADDEYVRDVRTRAQAQYQAMPIDALRLVSGRFFLKKRRAS